MASHIGRRKFLVTLGGAAAAWPLAARAQQGDRMRRLGILMVGAESDPQYQADVAVFREGLQKLGWVDGQNIRIEVRWAGFDAETMRRYAKELIALQPDLILSNDTPTTATLLQQTRTVPIVFATVADPIGSGFVTSFARPGGNATGLQCTKPRSAASGWSYSRRQYRAFPGPSSFLTRQPRLLPIISSNPSTTPRRLSEWR